MTIKILMVEDDALQLSFGKILLSEICNDIDTASTGNDAIEKILNNKYDLVFMDIGLPDIDGIEVTRRVRERGSKMLIVALTANDGASKKEAAFAAGMNEFVSKPITIEKAQFIFNKLLKNLTE